MKKLPYYILVIVPFVFWLLSTTSISALADAGHTGARISSNWILLVFGALNLVILGLRIDHPKKVTKYLSLLMATIIFVLAAFGLAGPIIHPTAIYAIPIWGPSILVFGLISSFMVLWLDIVSLRKSDRTNTKVEYDK